jgi:hypothetical protein
LAVGRSYHEILQQAYGPTHLTFAKWPRDARLTGREPPEAASKSVLP